MNSEFSRIEPIAKLAKSGATLFLEAKKEERTALAKRAGVVDVKFFEVAVGVLDEGQRVFSIIGTINAKVILTCGRTLKDFEFEIDEPFIEYFVSQDEYNKMAEEGLEERDEYEVFVGDEVDLGEMAAQLLILAIDPFPVLEGDIPEKIVTSGVNVLSEEQARAEKSPFAKLKKLKKNS